MLLSAFAAAPDGSAPPRRAGRGPAAAAAGGALGVAPAARLCKPGLLTWCACLRIPPPQELAPDCHMVKLGTMGEYGERRFPGPGPVLLVLIAAGRACGAMRSGWVGAIAAIPRALSK